MRALATLGLIGCATVVTACGGDASLHVVVAGTGTVTVVGPGADAFSSVTCTDAAGCEYDVDGLDTGVPVHVAIDTYGAADWLAAALRIDGRVWTEGAAVSLEAAPVLDSGDHRLEVTFVTLPACPTLPVTTEVPLITRAPRELCAGHDVTVIGSGLAPPTGCPYPPKCHPTACFTVGTQLVDPVWGDDTQLMGTLPPGTGTLAVAARTSAGRATVDVSVISVPAPQPTSLSPWVVAPGDVVTIAGEELDHVRAVSIYGAGNPESATVPVTVDSPTRAHFTAPPLCWGARCPIGMQDGSGIYTVMVENVCGGTEIDGLTIH